MLRAIYALLALGFFLLGGLGIYAEHKSRLEPLQAQQEEQLKRQSRQIATALEERLLQLRTQIEKSYQKGESFESYAKLLFAPARDKKPTRNPTEDLFLQEFLQSSQVLGFLRKSSQESYLLMKILAKDSFVVVGISPKQIFSSFASGANQFWVSNLEGKIFYHTQESLWGTSAANSKPVSAMQAQSREAYGQYMGLNGRKIFGAWERTSNFPLLVVLEANEISLSGGLFSLLLLVSILSLLAAGFFLFAFVKKESSKKNTDSFFDEQRLDPVAIDYLENAKRVAEVAEKKVQTLEAEQEKSRARILELASLARELDWKRKLQEEFYQIVHESWLGDITGKQVIMAIAKLLSERALSHSLVLYRYSPTTYSLVPEACIFAEDLEPHAKAFLQDARIYLANAKYWNAPLQAESFQKWERQRIHHMPMSSGKLSYLPISVSDVFQGGILLIPAKPEYEIGEDSLLLEEFAVLFEKLSNLCDLYPRLLQFRDAKGLSGQAVAGATNPVRSELGSAEEKLSQA